MEQPEKTRIDRPKRRIQRLSPERLLRQRVLLAGGISVSVERHKGRLMVRVESPELNVPLPAVDQASA